jgi:hypothetical protein
MGQFNKTRGILITGEIFMDGWPSCPGSFDKGEKFY